MILIQDVKYYQEQSSLVIVGLEVETRRPITQQITVQGFLESTGIFTPAEVSQVVGSPDRCKILASQLKSRREPFKLVFTGTQSDDDIKNFFATETARGQ